MKYQAIHQQSRGESYEEGGSLSKLIVFILMMVIIPIAMFSYSAIQVNNIGVKINRISDLRTIALKNINDMSKWQATGVDMETSLTDGFTRASHIKRTWSDLVEFDSSIAQVLFKADDHSELEMRLCFIEESKHKGCYSFLGKVNGPLGLWISK